MSESETDRQLRAQWNAIEQAQKRMQMLETDHAVINHKVSDISSSVQALRDTLNENHGVIVQSVGEFKNELHQFKLETVKEISSFAAKDQGKSQATAGTVAMIGLICTVVGALVAVITVTKGVGA